MRKHNESERKFFKTKVKNITKTRNIFHSVFEMTYKNKIIFIVFLFSTLFFLWQHSTGFSWDFAVYVLNARYLAGDGYYFEWVRQPLPSFILLLLSFLGWFLAEYAYIIIVSLIYLYSSMKFAEKFRVDKTLFYTFSMNAYVLIFGLKFGTELLSLALLQLFVAYLSRKRAGIFGGLSLLSRYSNLNFLVLILLQRNLKKIIVSFLLLLLAVSPWLYFNFIKTGSPFTSIRDSYLLNVVFRQLDGYVNEFNFFDILFAFNLLLPLAVFGLFQKMEKKDYLLLTFFVIAVVSYALIPFKEERYLFPITLPAAYFASKGAEKLGKEKIVSAFVVLSLVLLFMLLPLARNEPPYFYQNVKYDCAVQSNAWMPLNYYGIPSEPYPNQEDFSLSVNEGYRIILFKKTDFPLYMNNVSFINQFPIIEENEDYVIYGDASKCKEPQKYEMLFADRIKGRIESGDIACDFFSCRYLK